MKTSTLTRRRPGFSIAAVGLWFGLLSGLLYAQVTFEVLEFRPDPLNLKPEVSPLLDMNADKCALLRIESDLEGELYFTQVKVYKRDKNEPGMFDFYISFRERNITLTSPGFMPYTYRIPQELKPGRAYVMRVKKVGERDGKADDIFNVNRPEIRLKYTPVSADERVFGGLDGNVMRLDFATGRLVFRPEPGRHSLKLNSEGRIWEKTYDLTEGQSEEDEVVFPAGVIERWDLKEPGGLVISSEPPGAVVFLNQSQQGTTPLTLDELQPGVYQIEVAKDLYLAASRTIEVKSLEYADLKIPLTPNFGRVKIETDPPEAMVWINNQQRGTTPLEIPRFNAGKYTLKIAQNLYYDQTDTFEIKPGGEFVRAYQLKPQFGRVTLSSEPPQAEVTVDGALWGKTPLTHDKTPSGEHIIRLTLDNYFEEEMTLRVNDGELVQRQFTLRPRVGWLTVTSNPSGAAVSLTETKRHLGLTPLKDLPLDRGSYSLLVELKDYEPYETAVALTYGGRQAVEAKLIRSSGHIRVSVEPQGARIYLEGKYQADSPTVLKDIPTGGYEIRLEKSGYDIHLGRVQVNRNEVANYKQTLGTAGTREWLKRRNRAILFAIAAPGGGQFRSGQYVRGVLYSGAFVGSLWLAYQAALTHDDAKKEYIRAVNAYHASRSQTAMDLNYFWVQDASKRMKLHDDLYQYFLAFAGGIYTLQLMDAWLWGGGKKPVSTQLGIAPGEIRLSLSIPLEGSK